MRNEMHNMLDLRGAATPAVARERARAIDLRQAAVTLHEPRPSQVEEQPKYVQKPVTNIALPVWRPLVRVAVLLLLVGTSGYLLPRVADSLAYFTDTEAAPANMLASSVLDIEAYGGGSETISCGGYASFLVDTTFVTTRGGSYGVTSEFVDGDAAFCERLSVDAKLDGVRYFAGDLYGDEGLLVENATSSGQWEFLVDLSPLATDIPDGTSCVVDVVYRAWCPMTGSYGDGFSDEERVRLTITKDGCDGPYCEPCTGGGCGDIDVDVVNINSATVNNTVTNTVSTGGGSANGGSGGAGGAGTNGGTGGAGGNGGTVETGAANATTVITNVVNSNTTTVNASGGCGCDNGCDCAETEECGSKQGSCDESGATNQESGEEGESDTPSADDLVAEIQKKLKGRLGSFGW